MRKENIRLIERIGKNVFVGKGGAGKKPGALKLTR